MMESNNPVYREFLAQRRQELLDRIACAAHKAGRDPQEVTLLAVSKTVGDEEVAMAYEVGYRVFGENRPQELKRKVAAVRQNAGLDGVAFHMIGNLQTNKINQVLGNASLVHSVSSEHLAEAISRRSLARGQVTPCLLEVNVLGEASKSGFSPDEAPKAADFVMTLEGVSFMGLMTMAPAGDEDAAHASFSGLRELGEKLRVQTGRALPVLSCGMSGDFEAAVEEGSTLVRLGRIVFDPAYEGV